MNLVLIDSSVWIDYFRETNSIHGEKLNLLIDNNQICINELILSEIIPSLIHKKEHEAAQLLLSVKLIPISINWDEIMKYQTINLSKGLNNIGIPDLIIMQNALQNDLSIYSLDKHFILLHSIHTFKLFFEC